jgi:hypothetical protein
MTEDVLEITQYERDSWERETRINTRNFVREEMIRLGYEPNEDVIDEFMSRSPIVYIG